MDFKVSASLGIDCQCSIAPLEGWERGRPRPLLLFRFAPIADEDVRAPSRHDFMFSHRNHAGKAYVALGSNLGDRAGNLLLAVRGMMEAAICVCRVSSIYETQPVSNIEQLPFLNMVAEVGNPLPAPEQMMARLLRIEFLLGRTRDLKDGPRTIDLDLLLYGEVESDTEFLRLPHPRLHTRRFVLEPLVEIAPHLIHPTMNCTTTELLEKVEDKSAVKRWTP